MNPGGAGYHIPFITDVQGAEKLSSFKTTVESLGRVHGQTRSAMKDFISTINEEIASGRRLESVLKDAANAKGGYDKATQNVSRALLDQIKLTEQLRRETEQLRNAEARAAQQQASQAGRIPSLAGRLGGRLIGADIGGAVGVPGLGRFGGSMVASLGLSGGGMLALGATAAGAMMLAHQVKEIENLAKWVETQHNAAAAVGMTTQQMETLTRVSDRTGVNLQAAAKSTANLKDTLTQGGPAAEKMRAALADLGLSGATAFQGSYDGLNEIAKALAKIPDPAERSAAAVRLLGDSGRELAQVADRLAAMEGKVKILDPNEEKALLAAKDALQDFSNQWDILKAKAATPLTFVLHVVNAGLGALTSGRGMFPATPADMDADARAQGDAAFNAQQKARAEQEDTRSRTLNKSLMRFETPSMRAKTANEILDEQKERLKRTYTTGDVSLSEMRKFAASRGYDENHVPVNLSDQYLATLPGQIGGIEQQQRANEERAKEEESAISERRSQMKRLRELPVPRDAKELMQQLGQINGPEFSQIQNDPQLIKFRRSLAMQATLGNFAGVNTASGIPLPIFGPGAIFEVSRATQPKFTNLSTRQGSEFQHDLEQQTKRIELEGRANEQEYQAQSRLQSAVGTARTGMARRNMSPIDLARAELQDQLQKIREETAAKTAPLRGQVGELSRLSQIDPSHDPEFRAALSQLNTAEIEGKTKSVEVIAKFNEAIADAAQKTKQNFEQGFASLVLGAQTGGASGTRSAVRNIGTGIEHTVLTNLAGMLWSGGGGMPGIGRLIPHAGDKNPNSFMAKLFQGTAFGAKGKPEDMPLIDSNVKLVSSTDALKQSVDDLTTTLGGTPTTGSTGAAAALSSIPGGSTITSALSTLGLISRGGGGGASIGSSLAAGAALSSDSGPFNAGSDATTGSSASDGTEGDAFGLGTRLKSSAGSGSSIWSNLSGGNGLSAQVGASVAAAGAAFGAYQGIMQASKGGARNITTGIGETAMSVAAFTGPAAPFVAAAGALLTLAGSLFGDPKQNRQNQINKSMFTHQYLAPQAMNISESGNAGFSDTDIYGNVRASSLSPYPVVSNAYLDVPRRTVVPGHQVQSFGGYANVTGAKLPGAPTYNLTIQAIDSKDIMAHGSAIVDAFHNHISTSFHPVVNNLRGQLGLHS